MFIVGHRVIYLELSDQIWCPCWRTGEGAWKVQIILHKGGFNSRNGCRKEGCKHSVLDQLGRKLFLHHSAAFPQQQYELLCADLHLSTLASLLFGHCCWLCPKMPIQFVRALNCFSQKTFRCCSDIRYLSERATLRNCKLGWGLYSKGSQ